MPKSKLFSLYLMNQRSVFRLENTFTKDWILWRTSPDLITVT